MPLMARSSSRRRSLSSYVVSAYSGCLGGLTAAGSAGIAGWFPAGWPGPFTG